jgi:hypothetical protein
MMTFIRGLGASSSDETEPTWQQKILSRIHILILHFAVPLCSIVLRYHLRVPGPFVKRRASFWSKESMGGWKPCKLSCARASETQPLVYRAVKVKTALRS